MFDIIIIAMVALFIFLRLKSELGNHNDDDVSPPRHSEKKEAVPAAVAPSKAISSIKDPTLQESLLQMQAKNPTFDVDTFIKNATRAYELILEAFWSGDSSTLENLLSRDVFSQFKAAVDARNKAEHTLENKILGIEENTVSKATLKGSVANITMTFKTDIIAITRDKEGTVVDGDISNSIEVIDTWTFERDLKSNDPKWILVATHAG